MKLLAVDTSSLACCAGVMHGREMFTRYEEQPREHTRILMPMIREVLDEAKLALADLDAIVLGIGPGSFIGMRIAASVCQGLAWGAGLDIVPVSSLAAVAGAAGSAGDVVVVAQDAHMEQVYLGIFELDRAGLAGALYPEHLHGQGRISELDTVGGVVAAGAGWQRYPALLAANRDRIGRESERRYPSPETLLQLGAAGAGAGEAVAPQAIEPAYLRRKVAETPGAGRP